MWDACKTVGEVANLLAMTFLQQDDLAMAADMLNFAHTPSKGAIRGRLAHASRGWRDADWRSR